MQPHSVLIVDNEQRICRLISREAKKMGLLTVSVTEPQDFYEMYHTLEPTLLFLDLKMGEVDGVEVLRFLAKQDSGVSIVLISGVDIRVLESSARLGRSLGLSINGILQKPLGLAEIRNFLTHHQRQVIRAPRVVDRVTLTPYELRRGLQQQEFVGFYQPKIDLKNRAVVGVEVLARWQHPRNGLIMPDQFIVMAEENELISPLTDAILSDCLRHRDALYWQGHPLDIAVNISASLLKDLTLPDRLVEMLAAHQFDPNRLILEVTESGAMEDVAISMDILTRLRLKDIRVSIDDFGTGYSSMVQLYRLPFSEIKVDRSFVMDTFSNSEAGVIVKSIINLGRNLGLKTVAEGIEDQKTFSWLADYGCDIGQGYHMSKPLDVEALIDWLAQWDDDKGHPN